MLRLVVNDAVVFPCCHVRGGEVRLLSVALTIFGSLTVVQLCVLHIFGGTDKGCRLFVLVLLVSRPYRVPVPPTECAHAWDSGRHNFFFPLGRLEDNSTMGIVGVQRSNSYGPHQLGHRRFGSHANVRSCR